MPPTSVVPWNSSCAYRLWVISLMYFFSMKLRVLPDLFFFFWEKSRGEYNVNIMPDQVIRLNEVFKFF